MAKELLKGLHAPCRGTDGTDRDAARYSQMLMFRHLAVLYPALSERDADHFGGLGPLSPELWQLASKR
ncbi:hypothetical protein IE00_00330 [Paracoccus sp. SM22M-07]|nr:hypothetical protein IE00_00330 [Paracoccus sp. SM22M-07]